MILSKKFFDKYFINKLNLHFSKILKNLILKKIKNKNKKFILI